MASGRQFRSSTGPSDLLDFATYIQPICVRIKLVAHSDAQICILHDLYVLVKYEIGLIWVIVSLYMYIRLARQSGSCF